mmetsp:Transcript_81845/g.222116  ORF Transcript_81845/g.222116 Transcript_81845/m.222116 type:complete len:223 (+) Transcript_81845:960-1628(+)
MRSNWCRLRGGGGAAASAAAAAIAHIPASAGIESFLHRDGIHNRPCTTSVEEACKACLASCGLALAAHRAQHFHLHPAVLALFFFSLPVPRLRPRLLRGRLRLLLLSINIDLRATSFACLRRCRSCCAVASFTSAAAATGCPGLRRPLGLGIGRRGRRRRRRSRDLGALTGETIEVEVIRHRRHSDPRDNPTALSKSRSGRGISTASCMPCEILSKLHGCRP